MRAVLGQALAKLRGACGFFDGPLHTAILEEGSCTYPQQRSKQPFRRESTSRAAAQVSEPPDTPAPESPKPRETEASKMSFLSVFSFGGSPTSQDAPTPTPVQPAADEVVEIKVEAPAPEPAVEVKKEEPKPAPANACCVVC